LIIGKAPLDPVNRPPIDKEHARWEAMMKGRNKWDEWTRHLEVQEFTAPRTIELLVRDVDPTAARQLCTWLEKCDPSSSLDPDFKICDVRLIPIGNQPCPSDDQKPSVTLPAPSASSKL
jgi:hypothetical protein